MLLATAPAAAGDTVVAGFDLCFRPAQPACVSLPATYATTSALEACKAEADRYMALTIAYRRCMTTTMSDAILQLNDALDHLKCDSPTVVHCAGPTEPPDARKAARKGARPKPTPPSLGVAAAPAGPSP